MRICNVEGCDKKATGRGLCNPHYQRWYHGSLEMPASEPLPHGNRQVDIEPTIPNQFELGWLVGLLEGEGHFSYFNTQQIVLGMTDEDCVLRFKAAIEKILGQDKSLHLIVTNWRKEEKPLYTIRLYGANARCIMKLVVHHMGYRRRAQIWKALNRFNGPKIKYAEIVARMVSQ